MSKLKKQGRSESLPDDSDVQEVITGDDGTAAAARASSAVRDSVFWAALRTRGEAPPLEVSLHGLSIGCLCPSISRIGETTAMDVESPIYNIDVVFDKVARRASIASSESSVPATDRLP
jgi:hypothetical protein